MPLPKERSPTHPGQMLLKAFLEPMGLSQKAFAEHLKTCRYFTLSVDP